MCDQNRVPIVKTMDPRVKIGTYLRSSMQKQQSL